MMNETFVQIRLLSESSLPHSRFCETIDWDPGILLKEGEKGLEYESGAWWSSNTLGSKLEAYLVWFGDIEANKYLDVISTNIKNLRVVFHVDARAVTLKSRVFKIKF